MKKSSLALMMMGLIASSATQAAEVYNKNGNKLDVYGKVKAMHYMSDYDSKDGDQTYVRFGIKGETQINDDLTGCTTSKPGPICSRNSAATLPRRPITL